MEELAPDPRDREPLESGDLETVGARVGELVAWFESLPDGAVRDAVFELLQGIDGLHRAGLSRLVELLVEARGEAVLEELTSDPAAGPVLELYDLLPPDDWTQVDDALEAVRPYIHSHGGEVEVLRIEDGVVHIQLAGSCHGCSGSAITLQRGVEEALRQGYPGFQRLEVHELEVSPPAGFISLGSLSESVERLRRPEWTAVATVAEIPLSSVHGVEAEGFSVLLCNVGGEVYGFRDQCPACSLPLHTGKLSGTVLLCPWQNCAYDARTGIRVDGGEGRLDVYPIAVSEGTVKLALNVPGAAPVE